MLLTAAIYVVVFLFGMAAGGWLLQWIGRIYDQRAVSTLAAEKEQAWRCGYSRGYAAALGVQAEIDAPQERKER